MNSWKSIPLFVLHLEYLPFEVAALFGQWLHLVRHHFNFVRHHFKVLKCDNLGRKILLKSFFFLKMKSCMRRSYHQRIHLFKFIYHFELRLNLSFLDDAHHQKFETTFSNYSYIESDVSFSASMKTWGLQEILQSVWDPKLMMLAYDNNSHFLGEELD
jgi:hypothetical protein